MSQRRHEIRPNKLILTSYHHVYNKVLDMKTVNKFKKQFSHFIRLQSRTRHVSRNYRVHLLLYVYVSRYLTLSISQHRTMISTLDIACAPKNAKNCRIRSWISHCYWHYTFITHVAMSLYTHRYDLFDDLIPRNNLRLGLKSTRATLM